MPQIASDDGGHLVSHWRTTQTTNTLSSAEAKLNGICKGASTSIGPASVAKDLGMSWKLHLQSDASAAVGICKRRGLGKIRHLATADLWVQDRIRSKGFSLVKIPGDQNTADILTTYVDRKTLFKHLDTLGLKMEQGRASSTPTINQSVRALHPGSLCVASL